VQLGVSKDDLREKAPNGRPVRSVVVGESKKEDLPRAAVKEGVGGSKVET